MKVKGFSRISKTVLTHEGLFFKRPGDSLKALEYLSRERILVEVLDTEFAVLFEEAQKRKVTLEPYRDRINGSKAVCRLMKDKTLQSSLKLSYAKILARSDAWEVMLKMDVAGGLLSELSKIYGEEEAKRRHKTTYDQIKYQDRQIEGDYTFAFGLFFNTTTDLLRALQILGKQGFECVKLSSEVALIAFHLQTLIQDKEVGSFNLLDVARQVSRTTVMWKPFLRSKVKKAVLEEVHQVYQENPMYYKKEWSLAFEPGVEYEEFKESLIDTYSPSLRPDLFQPVRCEKPLPQSKRIPVKPVEESTIPPVWQFQLGI